MKKSKLEKAQSVKANRDGTKSTGKKGYRKTTLSAAHKQRHKALTEDKAKGLKTYTRPK